jgi:osmotically-inducible protein OsmY
MSAAPSKLNKPILEILSRRWPARLSYYFAALLLLGAMPLSGCASLIVGAAATAGVAAVQERSVGNAVDDITIRTELNQLFFEDSVELLQSVSFNVIEGRVLLKGSVKTQKERIHALDLVWQASGVREVINEIQVTNQGGIVNYARDTWISTQLTAEIMFDIDINAVNYNLETINGTIYVVGIARDQAELDKVIDHARRIRNVKQVVSHVILMDDPRRAAGP